MFQSLLNRRVVGVESGGSVNGTAFTSERVNSLPFGKFPERVATGYSENAIQVSEGPKPLKLGIDDTRAYPDETIQPDQEPDVQFEFS